MKREGINKPSRLHVLPGLDGVASVAALVSVSIVARDKVLGRKNNVDGQVGLNGKAVRQSLGGSEGPARAALLLVADGVDASRPLGARVERGRDGSRDGVNNGGLGTENIIEARSENLLGITKGPRGELVVHGGLPRGTRVLDTLDEVLVNEGHHVGVGDGAGSSDKGSKEGNGELQGGEKRQGTRRQ